MTRFIICAILFISLAVAAQSATVDFWFARTGDATGAPITTMDVPTQAGFSVSVWYRSSEPWLHNALELLVGYDQSNSKGSLAVPTIGKITASAPAAINLSSDWPIVLANNLGGGGGTGIRPYGAHLAVATALGTDTNSIVGNRVCDISLTNAMVVGGTQTVTILNYAGTSTGWTSALAKNLTALIDASAPVLIVTSAVPSKTIQDAKKEADGAPVQCTGIVTASFDGYFYIEDPLRCSGIRVAKNLYVATVGNEAVVSGTLATLPWGERQTVADSVDEGTGTALAPLAMTNKTLGGTDAGTTPGGAGGIIEATGLNNIGLYIRTTGHVSNASVNAFDLDDGSGVPVKVALPSHISVPANGAYVIVTGISSAEKPSTQATRVVLATDMRTLP